MPIPPGDPLPEPGSSLGDCPSHVWARLIEELNPASILVAIESRMGTVLRARVTPEDLWQETLLFAWRDRSRCMWQGLPAFRRWLLQVAQNRLLDLVDHENAEKRSPAMEAPPIHAGGDQSTSAALPWDVAGSTTPSRVAMMREEAAIMRQAVEQVPDGLREIVRLRYFEGLTNGEVAERLGLGLSAVKHRFRRGSEEYARCMRALWRGRSQSAGAPP